MSYRTDAADMDAGSMPPGERLNRAWLHQERTLAGWLQSQSFAPSVVAREYRSPTTWVRIVCDSDLDQLHIDGSADPSGVAAHYLGKREGRGPVYIGKVGTGWSRTVSSQIRMQLNDVVSPTSKLTKPIRKPKATWVEPRFVAEVEYRDITSEGLLRASSFKGLSKRN
jgi:ATP-dependent DNA ligase